MAVPSYILCQKIIKMVSIEEAITVPAWVCAKSSANMMWLFNLDFLGGVCGKTPHSGSRRSHLPTLRIPFFPPSLPHPTGYPIPNGHF